MIDRWQNILKTVLFPRRIRGVEKIVVYVTYKLAWRFFRAKRARNSLFQAPLVARGEHEIKNFFDFVFAPREDRP